MELQAKRRRRIFIHILYLFGFCLFFEGSDDGIRGSLGVLFGGLEDFLGAASVVSGFLERSWGQLEAPWSQHEAVGQVRGCAIGVAGPGPWLGLGPGLSPEFCGLEL